MYRANCPPRLEMRTVHDYCQHDMAPLRARKHNRFDPVEPVSGIGVDDARSEPRPRSRHIHIPRQTKTPSALSPEPRVETPTRSLSRSRWCGRPSSYRSPIRLTNQPSEGLLSAGDMTSSARRYHCSSLIILVFNTIDLWKVEGGGDALKV